MYGKNKFPGKRSVGLVWSLVLLLAEQTENEAVKTSRLKPVQNNSIVLLTDTLCKLIQPIQ
jgi:hypothetical protein